MSVLWKRQKAVRLDDFSPAEIDLRRLEIWEGESVEVTPAGKFHNELAVRLLLLFHDYCLVRPDLYRAGDNDGFVVARDPDTFLSPDAALYRLRREDSGPWHLFSPDIAAEILSPENTRAEMLHKRDLYLSGGSEQVWIVDPDEKSLEIHFNDGRLMVATEGVVECEGTAKGLKIDLGRLFEPPPFAALSSSPQGL